MKAIVLSLLALGAAAALAPAADAAPECYAVHNHWEAGPVDVYQSSSCSYAVCIDGDCSPLR